MAVRRSSTPHGISEIAWQFLNDIIVDDDGFEICVLESGKLDAEHGYTLAELWEWYGAEIVASWVRRRPGTRPYCWWLFESGLERKRGMQLTPKIYLHNLLCSLRESIPEDQRSWLAEHGHLQAGE